MLTDLASVNCKKFYWFEWVGGYGRFLEKTEAMHRWPQLLIDYLEQKLTWVGNPTENFVGCRIS